MWTLFPNRHVIAAVLLALWGGNQFASSDQPSAPMATPSPMLRIVNARTNFQTESVPVANPVEPTVDENHFKNDVNPSPPASFPTAESQPCVLLNNGNVLWGTVTQLGPWIMVSRDGVSEVQLARKDVACWGNSIRDLYQYRIDRRGTGSLASRLEDARWCLRYDLYDLAAKELVDIYAIAPDHPEAKRIEQRLRSTALAEEDVADVEPTEPAIDDVPNDPSKAWIPAALASSDRVRDFARFVQPLMINRCAQCHSHDTERKWQLMTPSIGSRPSARMTHDNLKAAFEFLDMQSPMTSEMLVKAQTPHGDEPRGVDARRQTMAATIQKWVESVHANVAPAKSVPTQVPPLGQFFAPEEAIPMPVIAEPQEAEVPAAKPATSARPARLPDIGNPFDPELFNRRFATGE
ncbi:putative secreted protein [Rhodopirellula maiorica SM1]|uniref:Putative secreted protein n=1 Tax=Rhodopirellula maiorica SM1 TaxID=1265738 RepID=M5RLV5_9BACT|nr:hypothetical protein [Rhodopirellula maiorica]EMI16362.1 putative secreted protein [Rhodopirellula maiorica SM1]